MLSVVLKIDDVDLTQYLLVPPQNEGWELERSTFGGIATLSFDLYDPARALTLIGLKEVILEESGDANTRYWGGHLVNIVATTRGIGRRFACKALGWEFDLRKTTTTGIYRGISDQTVLTATSAVPPNPVNIFLSAEKDLSAYTISTDNIEEGDDNIDRVSYQATPIADILDGMAKYAGFVWGVTPLKVIYYRKLTGAVNSFDLSDNPDNSTTFGYYNFKRVIDAAAVVNKVVILGGQQLTANVSTPYRADGIQTLFGLNKHYRAPEGEDVLIIQTNSGTDGTPVWTGNEQVVGRPSGTGTYDVIWSEIERNLIWTSPPPDFATNSFRVTGDIFEPLRTEHLDQPSIDELGNTFEVTINDQTINSVDQLEKRGEAELLQRGLELDKITLTINHDGIEEGKTVLVTNTVHGLAGIKYLVDQITMRPLSSSLYEYDLILKRVPAKLL